MENALHPFGADPAKDCHLLFVAIDDPVFLDAAREVLFPFLDVIAFAGAATDDFDGNVGSPFPPEFFAFPAERRLLEN
jgi:hypothetical protein